MTLVLGQESHRHLRSMASLGKADAGDLRLDSVINNIPFLMVVMY